MIAATVNIQTSVCLSAKDDRVRLEGISDSPAPFYPLSCLSYVGLTNLL